MVVVAWFLSERLLYALFHDLSFSLQVYAVEYNCYIHLVHYLAETYNQWTGIRLIPAISNRETIIGRLFLVVFLSWMLLTVSPCFPCVEDCSENCS